MQDYKYVTIKKVPEVPVGTHIAIEFEEFTLVFLTENIPEDKNEKKAWLTYFTNIKKLGEELKRIGTINANVYK